MNLYLLYKEDSEHIDDCMFDPHPCNAAIVAAENEDAAKNLKIFGDYIFDDKDYKKSEWNPYRGPIAIEHLGVAQEGIEEGIIMREA